MHGFIRSLLVIGGLLNLVLAYMFFQPMEWATDFWSWDDKHLSFVFMASMQAAIAAGMIWIGLSGELAALAAGGLNLAVMMAGLAVSLFFWITPSGPYMTQLATFCLFFALFNLLLFVWAQRIQINDRRPTPRLVQISYVLFIIALLGVGVGLLLQRPEIFPWDLPPTTSIIFGWMFIGDAAYFGYALFYGRWALAGAPLLSFLAYDLVLIQPFIERLVNVELSPMRRVSLIVYIGILIYSALLALYHLFFHAETRLWRPATRA